MSEVPASKLPNSSASVSGDDASEGVHRQLESLFHVFAQSAVLLLPRLVFVLHTSLDVVARIQAGRDFKAAPQKTHQRRRQ